MNNKTNIVKKMLYMIYLGVCTLGVSEIALRFFVDTDPAFYVAFSNPEPGSVVEYPYGEILYNSQGFADNEFDAVKSRPRVGYIGDSVCFGVGAGYGYRISELMEQAYPGYEHMNFTGGLGGGTSEVSERAQRFSEQYDLDAVVYLMNLNDIRPDGKNEALNDLNKRGIFRAVEWFRGRSYLYTYLRQTLKSLRNSGGGPPAYEMFPEEYSDVLHATATRVESIEKNLEAIGVRFVVFVLPYEMQVSADAAEVYSKAGTEWEPGFLEGSTQRALGEHMSELIVVDGIGAFDGIESGSGNSAEQRVEYSVGEAFVYNLGEKLDWNHPNRLGHRLLADELAGSGVLDDLGQP